MKLSFLTRALITSLDRQKKEGMSSGERITISRTVSTIAVLYERVRTAIEYREEHLLRRAAIERILKRRLVLNENGRGIAEYLLKELLWAKYAPEDSVPVHMISVIQSTIDKYIFIRNEIIKGRPNNIKADYHEWLISSAAAEIEQKIAPDPEREAFINFIFRYFQNKVFLHDETDESKDIQVYTAVHRSFAKSDKDFIRYELLKLSLPRLPQQTWKDVKDAIPTIEKALITIEKYLNHNVGDKLSRSLKKEMAPFLILRDLYEQERGNFSKTLENDKLFSDKVEAICRRRYEEIGRRLTRAGWRSIIYIFLSKMVFAFALEYPFEHYVMKSFNIEALAVNTLFPPFLMFLSLLGIAPPGEDNTNKIINRLREITTSDHDKTRNITIAVKTPQRRPILLFAFSLFYLLTFLMVFGGIVSLLTYFHFSIASQIVFVFFVSVVLFFAYRVRQTGREFVISQHESFLTPILSFFLLPVLNVGKWLSNEIARFNFFVAIFDFIIEAPFKAIFEIFEEWFSFLRRKREEII